MNVGSIVPALKYFAIVLRDSPVRRLISRIDCFSRSAIRRMMFKSPMWITPLPPSLTALGEGSHGSILNGNYAPNRLSSEWKPTARTLGAGKLTLYRTIILPAIFPELRATILLSLGTAWAAVVGAEYLGSQSGLGYILVYAQQFGYVDRMFFIGLLFIVFATISYAIFNSISARMLQWAPRTAAQARLA